MQPGRDRLRLRRHLGWAGSQQRLLSLCVGRSGKLLVVAMKGSEPPRYTGLFRCDLDGTACAYVDITAGQGANSALNPSAVIDAVNRRLLVVATNGANSGKLGLFSVDL